MGSASPAADQRVVELEVLFGYDRGVEALGCLDAAGLRVELASPAQLSSELLGSVELQVRHGVDGGALQTIAVLLQDAKAAADRAFVEAVLGVADDIRAPYSEALRIHRLA